jgi:hypothetical protein
MKPMTARPEHQMHAGLVGLGRIAGVLFILVWLGGFFQRGEPLLGLLLLVVIIAFVAVRRRRRRRRAAAVKAREEAAELGRP